MEQANKLISGNLPRSLNGKGNVLHTEGPVFGSWDLSAGVGKSMAKSSGMVMSVCVNNLKLLGPMS